MRSSIIASSSQLPVVSVVMTVYDGARFLRQAITSIINQSFTNFEFIIIDDGSTDGSRTIASEFAAKDRRLKVVSQENSGLIASLNRGCGMARGKYIARLDSDDIAMPDRLARQLVHLQRNQNIALLGGAFECIDCNGEAMFLMRWPGIDDNLHDYLLLDCYVAHTTVMFRSDAFRAIGGYRPAFQDAEDYDLFLRMSDNHEIDNLPSVLCQYRLHADQVSNQNTPQQVISGIAARLAARARRANCAEPVWISGRVTRDDLFARGIRRERIDDIICQYRTKEMEYASGWRWSKSPFCHFKTESGCFEENGKS
jgi:glycosyltransferase involved in cell wall biosynthesis